MKDIYFLVLLVLTGIGSAYITTILPRLKTRVLTFINARRNKTNRRLEQLEMRVDLHTRKDKTYLDKFDMQEVQMEELQEQINNLGNDIHNIAEKLSRREQNRKSWLRTEVKNYLKELQK